MILRDMPDEKANFIVGIREDAPESAKKPFINIWISWKRKIAWAEKKFDPLAFFNQRGMQFYCAFFILILSASTWQL